MIWLTHAIGGASSVLIAQYLFPDYFTINIWIIILSFYASQLPDIDIKNSSISKNILIKPFRFFISPFIDGHRAKQTHSIFWMWFYLLMTMPFILLFWIPWWLLLWIAYFSHVFLDYFNPTWVKLFYIPFLNSKPRAWSLYNTFPLLALEIPYILKKIFIWNKKERRRIKRKEIKFDWIWVMTWQWFEKVITYWLWIIFTLLIWLNLKTLKNWFLLDSVILTSFPLIATIIILTIYIQEKKNLLKYFKYFSYSFLLWIVIVFFSYFNLFDWKIFLDLSEVSISTKFFFILIFSLFPLFFILLLQVLKNIINLPKMVIPSKKSTSYFNSAIKYSTLIHLLLILLLLTSVNNLQGYNDSLNESYMSIKNFNKETFLKDFFKEVKTNYINSYIKLEKKIK